MEPNAPRAGERACGRGRDEEGRGLGGESEGLGCPLAGLLVHLRYLHSLGSERRREGRRVTAKSSAGAATSAPTCPSRRRVGPVGQMVTIVDTVAEGVRCTRGWGRSGGGAQAACPCRSTPRLRTALGAGSADEAAHEAGRVRLDLIALTLASTAVRADASAGNWYVARLSWSATEWSLTLVFREAEISGNRSVPDRTRDLEPGTPRGAVSGRGRPHRHGQACVQCRSVPWCPSADGAQAGWHFRARLRSDRAADGRPPRSADAHGGKGGGRSWRGGPASHAARAHTGSSTGTHVISRICHA